MEKALARAIDALDPPQREVLVLRDVEGLSAAEVANDGHRCMPMNGVERVDIQSVNRTGIEVSIA